MEEILALMVIIISGVICIKILNTLIIPIIIEKTTVKIEKNPKWLMPESPQTYYGFSNLDIITVKSPIGSLPRFHLHKEKDGNKRLELFISENVSVNDKEEILALALRGKIHIYYGLYFPGKSVHWLSILLYLLDGGEVTEIKDNKRVD